jgi:hypothetical protein
VKATCSIDVCITVDVEGLRGDRPLKHLIYGDVEEGQFGITKIMDLCDARGVKATFFVDVYEAAKYGEEAMCEVCRVITDRGHDVQLHAHPDQAYDAHRRYMADYSRQEQSDIIRQGLEWVEKWTGKRPVAFRAGGYGANQDTLLALRDNNIYVDASMFYRRRQCALNGVVPTRNKVVEVEGVMQIPTTVYQTFRFRKFERFEKVDVDACSLSELVWAFDAMATAGVTPVILFLHSHTFVRHRGDYTGFSPELHDVVKFDALLERLTGDPRFTFVTIAELASRREELLSSGTDTVPTYDNFVLMWVNTFRRAWGRTRTSRRALGFVLITISLVVVALCFVSVLLWAVVAQ